MAESEKSVDASTIGQLAPERLARLLDVGAGSAWSAIDAAQALRHQLAAPLLPDLAAAPGAQTERLENLLALAPGIDTFVELFTGGQDVDSSPAGAARGEACGELLEAAKRWARHIRGDSTTPLFEAPATVLYYAAIAAARVHHSRGITSLSSAQCCEGFIWAAGQPGAEQLAALFEEALHRLASG